MISHSEVFVALETLKQYFEEQTNIDENNILSLISMLNIVK